MFMKRCAFVFGVVSLSCFVIGLIALIAMAIVSGYGKSWMSAENLATVEGICKAIFYPCFGICGVCFTVSFFVENHKNKKDGE